MLLISLIAVAIAITWKPDIEPTKPVPRSQLDRNRVLRGEQLAAIGNCAGCHTATGGAPYAGGMPMGTPFGTLYSTNITPDPDTGIGTWSEEAFRRAMREGVSRDGHHLYPAFPYDHFTHLNDVDIAALYAFFMSRDPARQPARENELRFPYSFRPLLAGWKLMFLEQGPYQVQPNQDAEWNRGAYLADALAHCSSCHSPRNSLGAEEPRQYLSGGESEGWYAPALNAQTPSPQPWTVDALTTYLRTGIAPDHAMAGGPMQGVVASLARTDAQDVRALAVYIKSLQGRPSVEQQARAKGSRERASRSTLAEVQSPQPAASKEEQQQLGASVYASACARCHDAGRSVSSGGALRLPLAVAVYDPDPRSLIRIIRDGITPLPGTTGRWMPGFAGMLTDQQITALVIYLRRAAADAPAWSNVAAAVQGAHAP